MDVSETVIRGLQVLLGKRATWTVSGVVLLIALLFLRSPAHSFTQERDGAEPGEGQTGALIPSNPKFNHLTAE